MTTALTGATIPPWVPTNSGQPSAEELNALTAPRIMVPAANAVIPILYGRDRIYGRPFFVAVDDTGGFLYLGLMLCAGPIQSVDAIYLDGVDVTKPKALLSVPGAVINAHLGTVGDGVDPLLVEGSAFTGSGTAPPTFTDTMPGVAYLAMKIPKKASKGFPRVEAVVKGQKCYDPRKDSTNGGTGAHRLANVATWEWSENPTICYADFASKKVGWPINWPSVALNAALNDEVMPNGKARRKIGLTMATPNTAQAWTQGFRVYMGAFITWEAGALRIIPERADVDPTYGIELSKALTDAPYDYLQAPNHAGQGLGTGNFVISAKVRFNKMDVGQLLASSYNDSVTAGWIFYTTPTNYLRLSVGDGTVAAVNINSSVVLPALDDQFHEYSVHVDRVGGTVVFKIDGVQLGSSRVWPVTVTGSLTGPAPFRMGGLNSNSNNLFGVLDEVRVWNRLLTPEEEAKYLKQEVFPVPASLVAYYKLNSLSGAVAKDDSANANNAAVIGTPSWVFSDPQLLPVGVAYHFDASKIKEDGLHLKHRSSRNTPNSIMIEYVDDSYDVGWRNDRVQVDAPKVTAGQQGRRVSQISLPGIHDASQAYREAVERLNWFLSDLEGSIQTFDEGLNIQNGSVVAVTHPIGLNAKLFRVRNMRAKAGRWEFDLSEYDAAGYSDQVITRPTTPDTNLGNPLLAPPVVGLSAVEELFKYRNGLTGSRVRATWSASSYAYNTGYIVEGYVNGVRVFQSLSLVNEMVTPGVEELVGSAPVVYEVRVAVQTPYVVGAFSTVQTTILGKLAPPSNVPSLQLVQLKADQVKLTWGEATDIDIWRYEVRLGTTGSTWATATTLELVDGLSYTATNLTPGVKVFFLKARDSVGNESPAAISQSVTLALPPPVTVFSGFEVGGQVRLSWQPPVGGAFVARYRITYADIPQTFERTLDVVDTLTFLTNEVAEGTFRFRVYAIDDAGQQSATAPARDIAVSSDQDAFLADQYDFTSGTVSNMVSYTLRTDPATYWVTNMGGVFLSSPSTFATFSGVPLANYHASGAGSWVSETKDFGLLLTGNWLLDSDLTVLSGSAVVRLELSRDNVTYDNYTASPPISARGEYRYARVRVTTATSSTVLIKTPGMHLAVKVVPFEESGDASSLTSGPRTITLSRDFTAVKEITVTTINQVSALSAVVDNIQLNNGGGSLPSTFDIYVFDSFNQQVAADVKYKFKGV